MSWCALSSSYHRWVRSVVVVNGNVYVTRHEGVVISEVFLVVLELVHTNHRFGVGSPCITRFGLVRFSDQTVGTHRLGAVIGSLNPTGGVCMKQDRQRFLEE